MSPRRSQRARPREAPPPDRGSTAPETVEEWRNGSWAVRRVAGRSAEPRSYRCPGCDQEVPAAVPHVVAWPLDGVLTGVDHRRHWHSACWAARSRRGPVR